MRCLKRRGGCKRRVLAAVRQDMGEIASNANGGALERVHTASAAPHTLDQATPRGRLDSTLAFDVHLPSNTSTNAER